MHLTEGAGKKSNEYCSRRNYSSCNVRLQEISFSIGVATMPIETEVKIRLFELTEVRSRLLLLSPVLISERHFEDNFVLDDADGSLRLRRCLLRVRKTKGKESVTFKGPPLPSAQFKRREELEAEVKNADILLQIFEQIGLRTWFRYQKYREEYQLAVSGTLHVALDATPIGDYMELEGSEEGIRTVAAALGFSESGFLRDSYYSLFARFCEEQGRVPGHMVFTTGDESENAPR
jgi:adenylate cyclase class 2